MEIIFGPRQSGKTTKLIKLASEHNAYIVCHTQKEAQRIFEVAKKNGYKINLPLTYDEFISGQYYGKGVEIVYIDDAELLLQSLSSVPIRAITLTKEKGKNENTQKN